MSASDNLGPMFHGTNHKFKPGDIILPANQAGVQAWWAEAVKESPETMKTKIDDDVADKAFATHSYTRAEGYAHFADLSEQLKNNSDVSNIKIYKVVPVDPEEVDYSRPEEVSSKKGFKVIKKARWDKNRRKDR